MEPVLLAVAFVAIVYLSHRVNKLTELKAKLGLEVISKLDTIRELEKQNEEVAKAFAEEQEKNRSILSQKKYSETRLGQITEHLVPFLENCSHEPKNMHFLGNPIDYVIFDFDQGTITFLEVKSGNSKPSRRQKTVKHIIKQGRVYYEEIRVNEKGIKARTAENVK